MLSLRHTWTVQRRSRPLRYQEWTSSDVGRTLPLPPHFAEALAVIVRSRTRSETVAVYPVSIEMIAINDGSYVSTAVHSWLHRFLSTAIPGGSEARWAMFDCCTRIAWFAGKGLAQQILMLQSESVRVAASANR